MGNFPLRDSILAEFAILPAVAEASHREVIDLVGRSALFGTGLSFIDAHILAAVILTSNATLWTRDRRLKAAARQFGVDASID